MGRLSVSPSCDHPIYSLPSVGCMLLLCLQGTRTLTTGGQNLGKHLVHSHHMLGLDPEEHYHHPRNLSKCRFLFPKLALRVITQEVT